MSNNSPEITILEEGILSGFFFGAAVKTGINADPESILITVLNAFENAFEPLLPPDSSFHQNVQFSVFSYRDYWHIELFYYYCLVWRHNKRINHFCCRFYYDVGINHFIRLMTSNPYFLLRSLIRDPGI